MVQPVLPDTIPLCMDASQPQGGREGGRYCHSCPFTCKRLCCAKQFVRMGLVGLPFLDDTGYGNTQLWLLRDYVSFSACVCECVCVSVCV